MKTLDVYEHPYLQTDMSFLQEKQLFVWNDFLRKLNEIPDALVP